MAINLDSVKKRLRNLRQRQNIIHKSELFCDVLKKHLDSIDKTSEYYTDLLADICYIEDIIGGFNDKYCHITEKNIMYMNKIYKKHKIKIKFAQYYLDPETDKLIRKDIKEFKIKDELTKKIESCYFEVFAHTGDISIFTEDEVQSDLSYIGGILEKYSKDDTFLTKTHLIKLNELYKKYKVK